ncbi:hypothetical protein A3A76_01725 [Candidatus Woesebacteria bacterium RIFCSPLOWO2_01_FULL_39_23]|uniref:FAD-binding FR-type domain-containing protein n=1 Tax=Candidatus Woesebacteria bacterium RIFCSPHIGHO2_01_FULL_40_22 TaxID=1802499 RepID=A0A1F7YFZ1_9BACT|nr:MAG: hypothetical protein A2141_02300 [Candidatus Woesebacteria bacterium RBG_16_40_11]OGM25799.1 MAG: hypothetical protein A2628_00580 [Candidatus Woesebacteria bacterium RIFCSPHIGHO2_01_FULL_40_22]OGM36379.1 MAG: hypothetical protein A3E41_04795 [Candidatus Woesebacteria bacterium RIFCSPHIGHO2_12_FULL_38_9]OGM61752.1 MAG: hypothetical protein A3A76_01725 [Candidatus Woesebacteria bacterium RIFCSPLOWO2_01_FULL_39_23]
MNTRKTRILSILYFVYLCTPALLFLLGSGNGKLNIIYDLGKIFGITGLTLLVLQMLLSSRLKLLERGVGHNNLLSFHSLNAKIATTLLVAHPTFIFFGMHYSGVGFIAYIKTFSIYTWLGVITLTSLIMTLLSAIYSEKLGLKYELWRLFHKLVYFVILAGFIHSFFLGTEMLLKSPLYYWWMFLIIFALLIFVYRNFIRKLVLKNSFYRVVKIKKESDDVRSFYLKPLKNSIFSYLPGQFAYTVIYSKSLPVEEHHFTLSSINSDPYLSFTIKESGDYTVQLGKVQVGDKVRIEGPFGVFNNINLTPPFFLIAGGIGITPLMTMLKSARLKNDLKNYTLIYSNKNRQDVVFANELEGMKNEGLKLFQVLSQEKAKGYYSGRIDAHLLGKLTKGRKNASFFIVGPPPMMKDIRNYLMKVGVKKGKIFTERFSLK